MSNSSPKLPPSSVAGLSDPDVSPLSQPSRRSLTDAVTSSARDRVTDGYGRTPNATPAPASTTANSSRASRRSSEADRPAGRAGHPDSADELSISPTTPAQTGLSAAEFG